MLVFIQFFYSLQNGVYIGRRRKVDAVFGDEIVGISGTQLAHLAALVGQIAKEEGDTNQSIAPIVALWIDYSTITFAADNGINGLHLRGYVHLANSRSRVLAAMFEGNIAQGTSGTEVRHGVTWHFRQHIVGHTNQRILFAEHLSVFTNKHQTVYIGVNNDTHVVVSILYLGHNLCEIFLQRFRVMGEISRWLVVEHGVFHAQLVEQFGQNNTPHAVHRIDNDLKPSLTNGISINQL